MLKQLVWLVVLLPGLLLAGQPAVAQDDGCASAFDDVRSFTADVFEATTANIEDGVIAWDSTDWENIVRRVVGTSEFYLNNCTDPDLPLSEQAEAVEEVELRLHQRRGAAVGEIGGRAGKGDGKARARQRQRRHQPGGAGSGGGAGAFRRPTPA